MRNQTTDVGKLVLPIDVGKLTDKEVLAIRWHMGGHHASLAEKEEVLTARQDKLWEVIHRADKLDASGKHKSNEI